MSRLDLLDAVGDPVTVDLKSETPVLVNFWSTTCRSCLAEMPEFVKLHADKKYKVVAVSLDPESRAENIERMRTRFKMNFDVFRIADKQVDELFDTSRLAIPVTFVLGSDGRIDRILQGKVKKGDL